MQQNEAPKKIEAGDLMRGLLEGAANGDPISPDMARWAVECWDLCRQNGGILPEQTQVQPVTPKDEGGEIKGAHGLARRVKTILERNCDRWLESGEIRALYAEADFGRIGSRQLSNNLCYCERSEKHPWLVVKRQIWGNKRRIFYALAKQYGGKAQGLER